ncbi:MAG TPA: hemolysin, partial [Parabacteroides sp.]|nr:hemolysin [Parabacteroides sp.]
MEAFILLALILLNGVLSMSEIALVSARKTKFETEAKKGNRAAKRALKLSEDPDSFLSTIQIGITLIGILTGLYSGDKFAGRLAVYLSYFPSIEPYALTASKTIIVVIVTYLTLIWGELVPKRI